MIKKLDIESKKQEQNLDIELEFFGSMETWEPSNYTLTDLIGASDKEVVELIPKHKTQRRYFVLQFRHTKSHLLYRTVKE